MSPIDQKTRPLKENHLIQRVLHRPVELAPFLRTYRVYNFGVLLQKVVINQRTQNEW